MSILYYSQTFLDWLDKLRDETAKSKIKQRLIRAQGGNFGDYKSVGEGIFEMRITHGAGYCLYYTKIENKIYFLLNCGDKKYANQGY
jgi:putative addiction module killer protein